ncbi:MurR/RpiR family transcriptional regulator [Candidatus Stoquefichus massiliensis]|uniref:MurR/RpiR family transcriptional regulator n=1 Tax=Candidatus Stoquefichus massiliensis TaxID=1470350 RepID=UPI000484CA9A|nr:MurR/RpiR family transcriptional regulator [Candidatus Stoquefichus massiliensis]
MNIFTLLKITKDFTNNEKAIAQFILDHPHDFLNMNTKQISDECFVSTSSIYRLCDKLNLSGLSELKVKISGSIDSYLKGHSDLDFNFPVRQNQTHYEIIHKLKEDYDQTILATSELFQLDQLKHAVNAMKKAKVIDIYTSAGNIPFALNFQFQMLEIGIHVHVPIDEYQQQLIAVSSDETHLAIMISFEGRGLLAHTIPAHLNKNKTPIILISSPNYSPNDFTYDYHLYMSNHEDHYCKISSYSTRLSLLYILDILYTCYFERDYDNHLEKKLNDYHKMTRHE